MAKIANRYLTVEPWRIVEQGFHPGESLVSESLFSLGNEYQGVRGFFEEGYGGESHRGVFFNGVYEYRGIDHPTGHEFKGMVHRTHFMVNSPDWLYIRARTGKEELDLASSAFSGFTRYLDLSTGELVRSFTWEPTGSGRIRLAFRRFLSFDDPRRGYQRIEAEALDAPVPIELDFCIDFGMIHREADRCFWRKESSGYRPDDTGFYLTGSTKESGQRLGCSADLDLPPGSRVLDRIQTDAILGLRIQSNLEPGVKAIFSRRAFNHAERDRAVAPEAFLAQALSNANDGTSYDEAADATARHWQEFWKTADIEIDGDTENQQGIRFSIFHLHQAYRGVDPTLNVSAKGLTGEAYCGWAWWDTETYCLPFYLYSDPAAALNLLLYRYSTLGEALKRARELDCLGARYPMATINGQEAVGVWQHADLEIHVSGAVFYGIRHYVESTGNREFLYGPGIEILIEISRFYASRGAWSPKTGEYGFWGVMGPDEFAMMVHNNCYTNVLAKKGFEFTLAVLDEMAIRKPERRHELELRIPGSSALRPNEILEWERMASRMRIPYDAETGVYEQHDGFFDLPHIDASTIPVADYPIYRHWAYVRIFPNDLIKQPDVLLLQFLFNNDYSPASKRANFSYYEPRCVHESSLSPGIHAILAAELGMNEKSYAYVNHSFRLDLDNYNRNTDLGVHTTSMAAAWMAITYGFAGMRTDGGTLSFYPQLPGQWKRLRFQVAFRGRSIAVEMAPSETVFRLTGGEPVRMSVYGTLVELGDELRIRAIPPVSPEGSGAADRLAVSGVLFDLDGVLVSTDDYHYEAWKRIADEEGIPFDRGINHRLRGVGRMESLAIILEQAGRAYGEAERRLLADRKNRYYRELLESLSSANVLPGVEALLSELARRKVKMAVASSSRNASTILRLTGLADRFPVAVDGSMIQKGKPDPEVFIKAAARLGLVPGECIVVEDSDAGREAAQRAGMRCLIVGGASGISLDGMDADRLILS